MYFPWAYRYMYPDRSAQLSAAEAATTARRAEFTVERLEARLERQSLLLRGIMEACARKGVFTEDELREIVNEIDLSDGRLDGRFTPQSGPRACPKCAKTNGRNAVTCMYCGEPLPDRELI